MKGEDCRAMHKVYCYLRFINVRIDNTHIRKMGEVRMKIPLLMLVSLSHSHLPTRENWQWRFKYGNAFNEEVECRSRVDQDFYSDLKNSVDGYPHPLLVLLLAVERRNAESSKLTFWVIGLSCIDIQFKSSILRLQSYGVLLVNSLLMVCASNVAEVLGTIE
jgi:hypothetical protein